MIKTIHLSEATRFFSRSLKKGYHEYTGNAENICRQIVKNCYNTKKNYFMVSAGHFSEFYSRDFGWCTAPLIRLGYETEVRNSLEYALQIFSKHKRITTTINPDGIPFDFPKPGPDSLAYTIHSLRLLGNNNLIEKYFELLNEQILHYFNLVFDREQGLANSHHFSSMKDHAIRRSSCYDNTLLAMLKKDLRDLPLVNPFEEFDLNRTIKKKFWAGRYFLDDLSGSDYVAGDANVFPYWTGVYSSKEMLKASIDSIRKEGLDKPFPIKYTSARHKGMKFSIGNLFAPNYEVNSIWMHMGPLYVRLVKKINKKLFEQYLKKYTQLIETHKNFLEVFSFDGQPFKTTFYKTDESMLWASLYLDLF